LRLAGARDAIEHGVSAEAGDLAERTPIDGRANHVGPGGALAGGRGGNGEDVVHGVAEDRP
jgi:hypothetical protein